MLRVSLAWRLAVPLCVAVSLTAAGCTVERTGRALFDPDASLDAETIDAPPADDLGVDASVCAPGTVDLDGDPANGCECVSAPDACNGLDDDCDPATEDGSGDPTIGMACDGPDRDRCAEGVFLCDTGARRCTDMTPDSREVCGNAVDDDCDGAIDEADAVDTRIFYPDADGDGHATGIGSVRACSAPAGYLEVPVDDCDDAHASVYTGAAETCDGLDNDCSAAVDDGAAVCPCTMRRRGTHAYLFCAAGAGFAAAEAGCVGVGYNLATVEDAAESAWLQSAARSYDAAKPWWIGLSDAVTEGTFVWNSGSTAEFRSWRAGEPNNSGDEDCVEINAWDADAWNDSNCGKGNDFVCESP